MELKKLYDDAMAKVTSKPTKASTRSSSRTPPNASEVEEIQMQLSALETQLEEARGVSKSLKDKLRECARQLQDYETERAAIADILARSGVDTKGVLGDASISEDASLLEQDLSDYVNKLALKLTAVQGQLKVASRSAKTTEASATTAEFEEMKAQRSALEKRVESMRTAARTSREENSAIMTECEGLRTQISELSAEMDAIKGKLDGKDSTVSSEIRILEEENFELMKENKDLRKEASSLRAAIDRSSKNESSRLTPVAELGAPSGRENDPGMVNSRGLKRGTTDTKKGSSSETEDSVLGEKKQRVTAKAKPMVSVAGEGEEQAGECAQS